MEKQALRPVNLEDLEVRGQLAYRANLTFARLEGEWYRPHEIFVADKKGWPGDWEGRAILAISLLGRATHRPPAWLDRILDRIPQHLNKDGYFGAPSPPGVVNEQRMSGHSWFLRGLIETYKWRGEERVLRMIERVVENLLLPTKGLYAQYPITPEDRADSKVWDLSPLQSKLKTHAMTIDTGCAFMMVDGATQAYQLLRRRELKELIAEMIARFEDVDLMGLQIQTHATLSAMRGAIRLYETDGDPAHLALAKRIFDLYKKEAWTENYSNYNWFERPRWTEACAIVDSFIVATWLWKNTGDPQYLEDAHHIYFNSVCHAHRASGGFGSARCLGAEYVHLEVTTYEVFWCCTMRGGEVWHKAIQSVCYHDDNTLVLPFYHDATATVRFPDGDLTVREETDYPYGGNVRLDVLASASAAKRTLKFFAPSWTRGAETAVLVNGKRVDARSERGFLVLEMPLAAGDRIEFDLGIGLHTKGMINHHSMPGYHTFRHGPMILWTDHPEVLRIGRDTELEHLGEGRYEVKNAGIFSRAVLSPIADPYVFTQPGNRKQTLFKAP